MKPDFALTLSFEGIGLLRRVDGGWASLGEVPLDSEDLGGALADLKGRMPGNPPVKLVIPNEQIKYLTLSSGGVEGEALRDLVRDALDGTTPYDVSELCFDWSQAGDTVFVAAVANETLDEAEAFARGHAFEPACFVAAPPPGQFRGEVFFGTAASWDGPDCARDQMAIRIVAEAPVIPPAPAEKPIPTEPVSEVPAAPAVPPVPEEDTAPQELDAPVESANATDAAVPDAATAAETPDAPEDLPPAPAPAFSSIRASRDMPERGARPVATSAPADLPRSRLSLGGVHRRPAKSEIADPAVRAPSGEGTKAGMIAAGARTRTTEATKKRAPKGFFSRRQASVPPAEAPAPAKPAKGTPPAAEPPARATGEDGSPARAAVARIAALRSQHKAETPGQAAPAAAAVLDDESERLTVFGARKQQRVGGKPRYLGLILTTALLVFLLAVAAWASLFLQDGLTRVFDFGRDDPAVAAAPEVSPQALGEPPTSEEAGDNEFVLAALEPDATTSPLPDTTDTGLSKVTAPAPAPMTWEEAQARYAATGLWQMAPVAPLQPSQDSVDSLYVASIDRAVQQFDAVALPGAVALRNDLAYLAPPDPAPAGTRYTLDARGLVLATPEGTVNPDGVRVFAGLPPAVPPLRPSTAVPPQGDVERQNALRRLQAIRPLARPGNLVETQERTRLGGQTLAELAAFRPMARPASLKEEEERAQPDATAQAVSASIAPMMRPRDFAGIVGAARARQPEATQTAAAVAPRTVQPKIPSAANVARQATLKNAINLNRVNLIGVYGKPSSRRALVRLANGRYKKVKVGDRLDGGRVAAIDDKALRYTKGGRNITLDLPEG